MQNIKLNAINSEIKRAIKKDSGCFPHENKIKLIMHLLTNHHYNISLLTIEKKYNNSNYSAVLNSTKEKIFLRCNKTNDLTVAETFNGIIINHLDPFDMTLKIIGITKINEVYFCMYGMPAAYNLKNIYDYLKTYHIESDSFYTFEKVDLYYANIKSNFIEFVKFFKNKGIELYDIDKSHIIYAVDNIYIFDFSKCSLLYDEIRFDMFPSFKNENFINDIFKHINQELEYYKFIDTVGTI